MDPQNKIPLTYNIAGAGVAYLKKCQLNLPRNQVGDFCEKLHLATEKMLGVCFYYPDLDAGINTCRYEWMVSQGQVKYAARLGIQFIVSSADLDEVIAYISYGSGHPSPTGRPNFSDEELTDFGSQIEAVIDEARSTSATVVHRVTYLKLAQGASVGFKSAVTALGSTVLPTSLVNGDSSFVSPVITQVTGISLEASKNAARRKTGLLCALLTLTTGRNVEEYSVDWRGADPIEILSTVDPMPIAESLFPQGSLASSDKYVHLSPSLERQFEWLANGYAGLNEEWREQITNAIYAYTAGLKTRHSQPTLSSVAFIAALSPLAKVAKCDGQVRCSKCGDRPAHNRIGDAESISESIARLRRLKADSEPAKKVRDLVRTVYSKQRSAYEHDAVLRHAEAEHKSSPIPAPTNDDLVPSESRYGHELDSIGSLGRESLLLLVAEKSGTDFDYTLFPFELEKPTSQMSLMMQIKCPGDATVGFDNTVPDTQTDAAQESLM